MARLAASRLGSLLAPALALLVALGSIAALTPSPARAEDDPVCEPLSDAEVRARFAEVRGYVREHEPDTRHWATGFLSLHLAMVGVQLAIAASAPDEGAMVEGWIGVLSSTLGVGTLLVSWPSLVGAGDALDELPRDRPEEARASLARAEQRLRRAADQVGFVRSPFNTTLNALYLAGASSVQLVGWQRVSGAFVLSVGGSLVAQGRVLLFPTGIRTAWLRYRRAHPDAACEPTPTEPAPSVAILPAGLGAQLRVSF